jgi:hypothetical protein
MSDRGRCGGIGQLLSASGRRKALPGERRGIMHSRSHNSDKGHTKVKELVVVTFADDMDQAKEYETLLRLNDIPAVIRQEPNPSIDAKAIAVMVPEDHLDEAHVVIESQDAYDDFYDFAMEDEDEVDFDADLLDDEF